MNKIAALIFTVLVAFATASITDFQVPSNVNVECHGYTDPHGTGLASATSSTGDSPTITYSDSTHYHCTGLVITRTWKAVDSEGATQSGAQIITTSDTVAPTLNAPASVTLECTPSVDTTTAGTGVATATDACDSLPVVTYSDVVTTSACGLNTIVRTWTATDSCENEASKVQTIVVADRVSPTVVVPADKSLSCSDSTEPSSTGFPVVADVCDSNPTVTFHDDVTQNCGQTKVIKRTWTATDACGNSFTAAAPQVITVSDTVAPVLTVPADVTLTCTDATTVTALGSATATDDCAGVTVTYVDSVVPASSCGGSGVAQSTPLAAGQTGVITRTWTATDACQHTVSKAQIITVRDTVAPAFVNSPASLTVQCTVAQTDLATLGQATATDSCTTPVVTYSDDVQIGSCAQSKTVTRTWTAKDACGNTATYVQTIKFVDTVAPVQTPISSVTLEFAPGLNVGPTANGAGVVTATDNCDSSPTTSPADTLTTGCGPSYTINRKWTSTDKCGNSVFQTQTIAVKDTTAPALVVPPSVTLDQSKSTAPTSTPPGQATATDVGSTPSVSFSDSVTTPPTGQVVKVINRTWKAVDACNNQATGSQTISVTDTTGPAATPGSGNGCLWPPNHKYFCWRNVLTTNSFFTASDDSGKPVTRSFASCSILEETSTGGTKSFTNTGQCGISHGSLCIQSTRSGSYSRMYTVNFLTTDWRGNTTPFSTVITVPANMSDGSCRSNNCNDHPFDNDDDDDDTWWTKHVDTSL
eukprot:TRINITY_DN4199_c0_g1_i1.p1 TRINITY_DN4199_c0_g1~~TRINITY_DN4199_c0_g1_i1.p1  ORF type:complete len:757 (+),score=160.82 TRINITY_DN4199_c0_g1_i1:121-2391(+)